MMDEDLPVDSFQELMPGLFLGGWKAAKNLAALQAASISRVLALDAWKLHPNTITYLMVEFLDMPTVNLLQYLDICAAFIDETMGKGEKVLVHCVYGQSRSPAVCAGWMMKSRGLPFESAYELIKEKRHCVEINPGFVAQLQLYERMGCCLNGNSPAHAEYAFLAFALNPTLPQQTKEDGKQTELATTESKSIGLADEDKIENKSEPENSEIKINEAKLCPEDEGYSETKKDNDAVKRADDKDSSLSSPDVRWYRCRKCRRRLFSEADILHHDNSFLPPSLLQLKVVGRLNSEERMAGQNKKASEKGKSNHSKKKMSNSTLGKSHLSKQVKIQEQRTSQCTSFFIQPLDWILLQNVSEDDKLSKEKKAVTCPNSKCRSKIGSKTIEERGVCSCGVYICPSFQIIKSKID